MRRKQSKIGLIVFLLLTVAIVVLGVWYFTRTTTRDKFEYSLLKEKTADVLALKDELSEMVSGEDLESLDDFDAAKATAFAENVARCRKALDELSGLKIFENQAERGTEMHEVYERVVANFEKMNVMADVAARLSDLAKKIKSGEMLEDVDFAALKNSGVAYLKEFGDELSAFREKMEAFKEKYAGGDIDKVKMQEEYGLIMEDGLKLTDKYVDSDKSKLVYEVTGVSEEMFEQSMTDMQTVHDWAEAHL